MSQHDLVLNTNTELFPEGKLAVPLRPHSFSDDSDAGKWNNIYCVHYAVAVLPTLSHYSSW